MKETVLGLHGVEAVLRQRPEQILELWVAEKRNDARAAALMRSADEFGIKVQRVAGHTLDRAAQHQRHQGVIAQCRRSRALNEGDLDDILTTARSSCILVLVLDGVTDPHNLGACLRTAEAAGVRAVIGPAQRAAGITPAVRRASAGAAERIPFLQVTNLARSLRRLKESGLWLVGAQGHGGSELYSVDLTRPIALVLGAEGTGLRRLTRDLCDHLVSLPMAGAVESLNVSVAAGVFLYEAVRQRREPVAMPDFVE